MTPSTIPDHFGDPSSEYRAARERMALFERSDAGILRLTGTDALDLLQRTTTGELARLAAGETAMTVIQTETARILDWAEVRRRDNDLILVTGPGRAEADLAWLDRMVIMDDVTVEDLSADWRCIDLVGPSVGRKRLCGPAAEIDGLVAALLERGEAVRAGRLADESLRLEQGRPRVGRELTAETNPLEARLHESISFTKGCYPGQEVIARLITYKSLKRTLCAFELSREVAAPAPGANHPLVDGGAAAARITSVGWSYGRNAWLALGFARNDLAAPGTSLEFSGPDGPFEGRVLEYPPLA